jgi:hypothetical protein
MTNIFHSYIYNTVCIILTVVNNVRESLTEYIQIQVGFNSLSGQLTKFGYGSTDVFQLS